MKEGSSGGSRVGSRWDALRCDDDKHNRGNRNISAATGRNVGVTSPYNSRQSRDTLSNHVNRSKFVKNDNQTGGRAWGQAGIRRNLEASSKSQLFQDQSGPAKNSGGGAENPTDRRKGRTNIFGKREVISSRSNLGRQEAQEDQYQSAIDLDKVIEKGLTSGTLSTEEALKVIHKICETCQQPSLSVIPSCNVVKIICSLFQSLAVVKPDLHSEESGVTDPGGSGHLHDFDLWNKVLDEVYKLTVQLIHLHESRMASSLGQRFKDEKSKMCHIFTRRKESESCIRLLVSKRPASNNISPAIDSRSSHAETTKVSDKNAIVMGNSLQCLTAILQQSSSLPSPEYMADEIVYQIMIPLVDQAISGVVCGHKTGSEEEEGVNDQCVIALDFMSWLLDQDRCYSTALLCPLTIDVSEEGTEQVVPNHICNKIITSIQSIFLASPASEVRRQLSAGRGLLAIIMAAAKLLKSNQLPTISSVSGSSSGSVFGNFDMKAIADRVVALMSANSGEIRIMSLSLLSVFAEGHPPFIASSWRMFVIGPRRRLDNGALQKRIESSCKGETVVAWKAAQHLIATLPYSRLMMSSNRRAAPPLHRFGSELSDAVVSVVKVLVRVFQKEVSSYLLVDEGSNSAPLEQMCSTASTVITAIPYDRLNDVVPHAVALCSTLGKLIVQLWSTSRNADIISTNHLLIVGIESFLRALGGRETPSGSLSTVPLPVVQWLRGDGRFWDNILDIAASWQCDKKSRLEALEMIGSIVRVMPSNVSIPQTDSREAFCQHSFADMVCQNLSKGDESLRLATLDLARQFLSGRQDSSDEGQNGNANSEPPFVTHKLLPLVEAEMSSRAAKHRCSAVSCVGLLTSKDWFLLITNKSNTGINQATHPTLAHTLVTKVGSLSVQDGTEGSALGERNPAVRTAAIKTLGSVCTVVLTDDFVQRDSDFHDIEFIFDFQQFLCNLSLQCVQRALDVEKTQIQAMVSA
jgi:hypothetical protein